MANKVTVLNNDLSAFMAENAINVENIKFAPSVRFLSKEIDSKTGERKPMKWEIKTINKKSIR